MRGESTVECRDIMRGKTERVLLRKPDSLEGTCGHVCLKGYASPSGGVVQQWLETGKKLKGQLHSSAMPAKPLYLLDDLSSLTS